MVRAAASSYVPTMTVSRPERIPGKIKWAIAGLAFQTLGNGLGALVLLAEAQSRVDHGQDGAGTLRMFGVISVVVAVLLAVCAVMAIRGAAWVWPLAIGLEVITVLSGLFALLSAGAPGAGIGILIGGGIIALLSAPESQLWFGRHPNAARQVPERPA